MAKSGKTVDPILIGIIAVGVVGLGVFYFMKDGQAPAAIPEPTRPDLSPAASKQMAGNGAMWGLSTDQGGANQMAGGPAPGPGGAPGGAPGAATAATGASRF